MLDPDEFLSDFGVRSVSRYHLEHPFVLELDGARYSIGYEPGDSRTALFGGNSNWRGPVWFPINFLLIESLRSFHTYYGDDFLVECPTGSGRLLTLAQIADELSARLVRLFTPDASGNVVFHEFFHGDTGQGLGASHHTGWTALVASLLAH
jgi:hypothetical protein